MERRIYDRSPIAFQVCVTEVADPQRSASGETVDISRSGIAVMLPIPFLPGKLVRLEIADTVLLGFVNSSQPWPPLTEPSFARDKFWIGGSDGGNTAGTHQLFRSGIEIVEVTLGTSGLSQILKANFQETMPNLELTNVAG